MTSITHAKTKIILLTVSALFIGGLGCSVIEATGIAVETAKHNKAAAAFKVQQEQRFKGLAIAADKGDLAAMTELGIEHLSNSPFLIADRQKGKALIESAADQHFAAAEYYLGIQLARAGITDNNVDWLLPKRFTHDLTDVFSRDSARALEYLKKSAQHSCIFTYSESKNDGFPNTHSDIPTETDIVTVRPAFKLSMFFKPDTYHVERKKIIEEDATQYELWFARSILHCNFPLSPGFDSTWHTDSNKREEQIINMAFFRLTPPEYWNYSYDDLIKKMPEDAINEANKKAHALRIAVKESEKEYPAPKMIDHDKNEIISKGKEILKTAFDAEKYNNKSQYFITKTSQLLTYSQHIQDYSTAISQYTNSLMIHHLKTENGQAISPENINAAKTLLDFYIDKAFPILGKNTTNDHLFVASTGFILSVSANNTAIADKIFEKLLDGKKFNINQVTNYNLVYNIACFYATHNRKPELMKAVKKLSEDKKRAELILTDIDFKNYANDKDVLAALGHL